MEITLDDQALAELKLVLDETLHELTSEIADTDNASYRTTLRRRRQHIEDILVQLEATEATGDQEQVQV